MASKSQLTLVMVDDNADEIFITRKLVRQSGIVNDFISERKPENLFPTLSNIARFDADKVIILLDISMPRMDGFETLRRIRASADYKDVPVIMLSASDNEGDISEALALGANGYLVKPFRAEEFFVALAAVANVKHQLVLKHQLTQAA